MAWGDERGGRPPLDVDIPTVEADSFVGSDHRLAPSDAAELVAKIARGVAGK